MRELKDITGKEIREGDLVMFIKPKRNRFGRYFCRAFVAAKPKRKTRCALVLVQGKSEYERHIPTANEANQLRVIGTPDNVDHELSAAMWAIAQERSGKEGET